MSTEAVNMAEEIVPYYIGSAEGHEYPDLQVGDEVNPRPFFGGQICGQMADSFDLFEM